MLYRLTNFRFIVIKLFYTDLLLNLINAKTLTIINLATITRAIRLIIEIPFY